MIFWPGGKHEHLGWRHECTIALSVDRHVIVTAMIPWVGWPANIDCTHDCEDEWREDHDCDNDPDEDYYDYDYDLPPENVFQTALRRIKIFLLDLLPFRCDVCGRWSLSKHRPCCSQKCADEWVPF